jgi:hypothetical protein
MWLSSVVLPLPRKPVMTCRKKGGKAHDEWTVLRMACISDRLMVEQRGVAAAWDTRDDLQGKGRESA